MGHNILFNMWYDIMLQYEIQILFAQHENAF